MPARLQPLAAGLHADQPGRRVEESGEGAHGVAPTADAGHDPVGIGAAQDLAALGPGLLAHHPLELPHHPRIGMGPDHRPDAVVGVLDRGHPVAQCFVDGVLQRGAAGVDGHDLGAEQPHAEDVEGLAVDVDRPHEHLAPQAEQGGGGGGGHAVLAGTGLGDHRRLAHVAGQQCLAEHVVDLVGAGVGQVLPLEQHPQAQALREPPALGHRRGPAGVAREQRRELGPEPLRGPRLAEGVLQFHQRRDQRLGDEPPPEVAEPAPLGRLRPRRAEDDGHPARRHGRSHVPSSAQS